MHLRRCIRPKLKQTRVCKSLQCTQVRICINRANLQMLMHKPYTSTKLIHRFLQACSQTYKHKKLDLGMQ